MKMHIVGPVALMVVGAISFLLLHFIGTDVAPDGTLIEPFFLIPAAYFFLSAGLTWGIIAAFTHGLTEKRYLPLAFFIVVLLAFLALEFRDFF